MGKFARLLMSLCIASALMAAAGCGPRESVTAPSQDAPAADADTEASDREGYVESFDEVTPSSANEKAAAAQAATYYDSWVSYRHNINPDVVLPSLEELGGNTPRFIGYKVDAYSDKDDAGEWGQFSLLVSGEQMNIAPKIGYTDPIDLDDPSTLEFFSTRTPLHTWDVDPHHEPQSEGERAALAKVQAFVETLPAELRFRRERVAIGGYTFFWGKSPSSDAYLILSVQPGRNNHYASANYGPMR